MALVRKAEATGTQSGKPRQPVVIADSGEVCTFNACSPFVCLSHTCMLSASVSLELALQPCCFVDKHSQCTLCISCSRAAMASLLASVVAEQLWLAFLHQM